MGQHLTLKAGLCLVGCLQLVAFTSLLFQLPYLYGRDGLQPISRTLQSVAADRARLPSLLWLHGALGLTAEALLTLVCTAGWLLSAAAACGVVHPLVFCALWLLYLSVGRLDSFVEFGDEVLLEVTFAAIWLAVAHRAHRRAQQQHMLSAQRLKEATLLLVKWLLFRLLLLTSSFSATYLCGPDPGLSSCWKTLLAHGLPHAATRLLMGLPGPVAALAAAISFLELPAAFLVLLFLPALQQATAGALLVLQLLKLAWGSAGLETLAAAVLCFLLLEDRLWYPWVAKLGEVLRLVVVQAGGAGQGAGDGAQHEHGTGMLSRQSSGFSTLSDATLGLDTLDELGPSLLDRLTWQDLAALAAFATSVPLLLSFSPKLGLLLRPTPMQLLRVLRVLAPLGLFAWAAAAALACYRAVATAVSESKEAAAEAAQAAADAKEEAGRAAAEAVSKAEAADTAAQQAAEAAAHAGMAASAPAAQAVAASPEAPASGCKLSNGVHEAAAASGAEEGAETGDEGEAGASRGRGRRGSSKAGAASKQATSKAAAAAAAAKAGAGAAAAGKDSAEATAEAGSGASPRKAAKSRTPSKQQQQLESPEVPTSRAKARSASKTTAAAAAEERARHAREEAEQQQRYAAAAQAAAKQHAWQAAVGAWVPVVCAGAAALVLLAVLLAGGLQVLAVAGYSPMAVRHVVPGPVFRLMQLGQTYGLSSGSSTARSSYLATRRAAAAAGPGAVLLYEAYVSDGTGGSWQRVPLRHGLGSAQLRGKGGWVQQLLGTRGWFQLRLQGRMAAAAAAGAATAAAGPASGGGEGGAAEADVEPWLLLLADKLVRGAPELAGLLDAPVSPHDYVTLSRAAYSPSPRAWRLDAQRTTALLQPQERTGLREVAAQLEALPGRDGWLVTGLHCLTTRLSGPVVLAALLLLVVLRHLLLPGGLLRDCQHAALLAAAATALAG